MSGQWGAAARRGQVDLVVLTPRRAGMEGYVLRGGATLIGLVQPFDGDEVSVGFRSIERIASWVKEMAPRELRVLGVGEDDAAALREALADFALAVGMVQ